MSKVFNQFSLTALYTWNVSWFHSHLFADCQAFAIKSKSYITLSGIQNNKPFLRGADMNDSSEWIRLNRKIAWFRMMFSPSIVVQQKIYAFVDDDERLIFEQICQFTSIDGLRYFYKLTVICSLYSNVSHNWIQSTETFERTQNVNNPQKPYTFICSNFRCSKWYHM